MRTRSGTSCAAAARASAWRCAMIEGGDRCSYAHRIAIGNRRHAGGEPSATIPREAGEAAAIRNQECSDTDQRGDRFGHTLDRLTDGDPAAAVTAPDNRWSLSARCVHHLIGPVRQRCPCECGVIAGTRQVGRDQAMPAGRKLLAQRLERPTAEPSVRDRQKGRHQSARLGSVTPRRGKTPHSFVAQKTPIATNSAPMT